METTGPIAHPRGREIPTPHAPAGLILRDILVTRGRPVKADDLARPPLTHVQAYPQQRPQYAFLGRL
jgi:hypothetical protein